MFKKLFIPYDLSKPSQKALLFAVQISGAFHSSMKVVHVLGNETHLVPQQMVENPKEMMTHIQKEIDKDVRTTLGSKHEQKISVINIEAEWGAPASTLLKRIEADNSDLVIMGTHGRTRLKHILLGSVAEKIIRHSPAPVLIVRGSKQIKIKKVLLPVDFSPATEEAILLATQFCTAFGAELHLVHVVSISDVYATFSSIETNVNNVDTKVLKQNSLLQLEKLVQRHPSVKMKPHVLIGLIQDEITKFASRMKADLIFIPTHGRSGLSHLLMGSVAETVCRYAPCSVLTFTPTKKTRVKS